MNINYSEFECPTMTFVKGSGQNETFDIVVPACNSNCEGAFDPIPEASLEAVGMNCAAAIFS